MYTFEKTLPTNPDLYEKLQNVWHFHWESCADRDIIDQFIEVGESLPEEDASIGNKNSRTMDSKIRISKVSWIHNNEQSKSLFDFIQDKVDRINYWHFGFALTGMESLQYTRYPLNGHYNFHNDITINRERNCRKLSIVLSLSDKTDYEGGEFQLMPNGINPTTFKFGLGDLIAFPSWVPHKVEPVTDGKRITVVGWVCGPKFV